MWKTGLEPNLIYPCMDMHALYGDPADIAGGHEEKLMRHIVFYGKIQQEAVKTGLLFQHEMPPGL